MIFSDIAIINKTLAWIQDKNVLDFENRTEIQRGSRLVIAELRTFIRVWEKKSYRLSQWVEVKAEPLLFPGLSHLGGKQNS